VSQKFEVECDCGSTVRDISRKVVDPFSSFGGTHPLWFVSEESAMSGWETHRIQIKKEFPGSKLNQMMHKTAKLKITEIKTLTPKE
jgi:hypothetical protein